ncbi:MAG TPA: dockerin type I domain-containing protein [Candidatus Saccharimonadales bacterium]|nr:dockerin type I domain-containing protein [Candidatus Saccharimonadales bacterium]
MDPEEKNHYKFFYTRNTPFSFRFIGVFVVLAMFATIPLVVLTINNRTNEASHASVLAASLTPTSTPGTSIASYASISLVSPAISTNGGNTQPSHSTRLVSIKLFNIDNQQTYNAQDTLTFDGVQSFNNPHFSLGSLPSGTYQLLIDMPGNLQKLLTQTNNTNTFSLQAGSTIVIPATRLIPGDIAPIPGTNDQPYGDNILDISDYNVLIGCYSDTQTASSCSSVGKTAADLNDDGKVDAIDYNILLRSFATRDGDSLPILSLVTGTITPSTVLEITSTPTPTLAPGISITPTIALTMTPTITALPTATTAPISTTAPTATTAPVSSVICSSSSNPQCSYALSCSTSGVTCQCADKNWSGHDKVYQCQSGSWKYINDTTQSSQYVCTSPCGNY